jgi:hypothetical protein
MKKKKKKKKSVSPAMPIDDDDLKYLRFIWREEIRNNNSMDGVSWDLGVS